MTETLAGALVLGAVVSLALVVSWVAAVRVMRRLRGGHRSPRPRETLFVARWGDLGPEMYKVGKAVRRLPGTATVLDLARDMLAEVMCCQPAPHLARAFAAAELEPLPPEGLVLSTGDVKAWLARAQIASRRNSSNTST